PLPAGPGLVVTSGQARFLPFRIPRQRSCSAAGPPQVETTLLSGRPTIRRTAPVLQTLAVAPPLLLSLASLSIGWQRTRPRSPAAPPVLPGCPSGICAADRACLRAYPVRRRGAYRVPWPAARLLLRAPCPRARPFRKCGTKDPGPA